MKIIEIDREKLIYLIKHKKKSGVKIRIVEDKNGCSSCMYYLACAPLQRMCLRILAEVTCPESLNLPRNFTIRKE